jgi:hypothetical protein
VASDRLNVVKGLKRTNQIVDFGKRHLIGLSTVPVKIYSARNHSNSTSHREAASRGANLAARNQEILQEGFNNTQLVVRSIRTGVNSLRQAQDGKSQLTRKLPVLTAILDEKRQTILHWLSPSKMEQKQQDTYSRHQKNTAKWLFGE